MAITPLLLANGIWLLTRPEGYSVRGQYSAVTGYGLVFGKNANHSITHQYNAPFEFTVKLNKVAIELK